MTSEEECYKSEQFPAILGKIMALIELKIIPPISET